MIALKKISFVIACYNSEHTIRSVLHEIRETMTQRPELNYELITVVDQSPDRVFDILCEAAATDIRLKVIELAKNVGKHGALMAGYAQVTGDTVVTLDDDGQCPVDRLWELLEPLGHGFDMAIAKNGKKKQSVFRNFGSWINAEMAHILIEKPRDLQLSNFFAMQRFICDEILRYKSPYPYIDGLYLRATTHVCNVPMEDRQRLSGKSGYTLKKCLSLFVNGFTAFSVKPLRVAMVFGGLSSLVGFIVAVMIIIQKIYNPNIAAGYTSLMGIILIVGGIIMVLLGIIGEYIGRIYISINSAPQYVIRRSIHCTIRERGNSDE